MKTKYIVSLFLLVAAIAALSLMASDMSTYATFEDSSNNPDKAVKINGTLSKGKEIYYDPIKDPNYFSFYLKDAKGVERKVVLKSAKPQDFERSEQIVLTGKMQGEDFIASDMLLKCPSKYKDEEVFIKSKS